VSVIERSDQVRLTFLPSVQFSRSFHDILEEHDGYWTVRNPETGIFGSGADPRAAFDDFENALREHLDVLSRQDSLSDDLQAQLRYLQQRLT
jgi:hypothetical protein